jgi:ankyrin repeat protein
MVGGKNCLWVACLLALYPMTGASDIDIFTAAEQGDLETVKELVQKDPQLVTAVDDGGYSPLHKAAYNNFPHIAEYLVSQGADLNASSGSGSTPLHGAAYYGHPEMVRLLVEWGAEFDVENAGGYTPLLSAGAGDHAEIVRILVGSGANMNASSADGRTPLFQAVWNADVELTGFLLDHGAEADIPTPQGVSLPFFAVALRDREFGLLLADKAPDFAETDEQGLTMLHYSAARGFADQVHMFLENNAETNAKDSLGRTPLYYASLWGHEEVAGILKASGGEAEVSDQPWFERDYLGRPAPGKTPVEFVGDELSTPFSPHGRLVFSPDGNEMFWCHQAMPIQAMWYSRRVNNLWQRPIIAPFTDPVLDFADGNPCFSADGRRVYYHTHRLSANGTERKEDTDIWYVEKDGGGWGAPVPFGSPVNTDRNELGPHVAPSGNLYFTGSDYEDSQGTSDIYLSEYLDGSYTAPKNLGPAINSEYNELSPIVPSDESYILFASNRPHMRRRNLQLYVSFKQDGGWTRAVPLGRTVNQGHTWCPSITADGKYVIYQQGTSYYWFSTMLIEDIRVAMIGENPPQDLPPVPVLRKSAQIFEHAATHDIALGDLDSDGDLDAVFSNMHQYGSRVYLNDGRGHFEATEQVLAQDGHGVDLGDLDADGDTDIIMSCAEYGTDLMVYLNDGRANFTVKPQSLADSLLAGNAVNLHDFDTDGDLDAAVVYYQEDDVIYFNDGQGNFTKSGLTFPQGSNWADLDGDGDVDNFHRETGVGLRSLLNDGSGNFVEHWSQRDSAIFRGWVGFGDFDADGDLDAVVTSQDQSEHRYSTLWHNDGTGRFEKSDAQLPLTRFSRTSTGDLNGDGHPDVFVNNFGLPSAVWLNDGKGSLFDSGIRLPGEWLNTYCPLGDLDGDGDLDVFIAAYAGGPNEIWFND